MDVPDDWPFSDDPPNVAVIATRGIMDGSDWIALASLDEEDGAWQFIGSDGPRDDQAMMVALHRVLAKDRSIAELANLPPGWQAWREGPDQPWQRAPHSSK